MGIYHMKLYFSKWGMVTRDTSYVMIFGLYVYEVLQNIPKTV